MNMEKFDFKTHAIEMMKKRGDCEDEITWLSSQCFTSWQDMWEAMDRPDSMMWIARRAGVSEQQIKLAALSCAEWALQFSSIKDRDFLFSMIQVGKDYLKGIGTKEYLYSLGEKLALAVGDAETSEDNAAYAVYMLFATLRGHLDSAAYTMTHAIYSATDEEDARKELCRIIRNCIPLLCVE